MTLGEYELSELHDSVSKRINDMLMPALLRANRMDELPKLLELLCMNDLISDRDNTGITPTKIAVLGASMVDEGKLRSIARKRGFDIGNFEFALGYNELKHFNFDKLRDSITYCAVLVGPMPHSTPGKRDASSVISEMEAHPERYPRVIEIRDSSGLKITNNSFGRALEQLNANE